MGPLRDSTGERLAIAGHGTSSAAVAAQIARGAFQSSRSSIASEHGRFSTHLTCSPICKSDIPVSKSQLTTPLYNSYVPLLVVTERPCILAL